MVAGITRLEVGNLNLNMFGGGEWPFKLIGLNYETLKHLRLGMESDVAENYAAELEPSRHYRQLPESFAKAIKNELPAEHHGSIPSLCLNNLEVCGLNVSCMTQTALGLRLDFASLTRLNLESCPDLIGALELFTPNDNQTKTFRVPNLTALRIRHEVSGTQYRFRTILEHFLKSLTRLVQLEVLIDRTDRCQNLKPILDVHGETLEQLMWEERSKPRTSPNEVTSLFRGRLGHFQVVARQCPNLTALALPLN